MSQELLERGVTSVVTRRTILRTGVKLAYAAPLVAVTMKVSGSSAFAASGRTGEEIQCWHSIEPGKPNGCKETCTSTGCSGGACDGCSGGIHPCDACCTAAGGHNLCPTNSYCDPRCFSCVGGVAHFNANGTTCIA